MKGISMGKDIMEVLIAVVAAFGGWQFVKYMLNLGANRRITAADAFTAERKAIMEDYSRVQKEVDEAKDEIKALNRKVDELYKQVHNLERERLDLTKKINDLTQENGELRLRLKEAEHNVCMRPDGDCIRRLPARTYCALYQVAEGRLVSDEARKDKERHEKDDGIPEKPDTGEQP